MNHYLIKTISILTPLFLLLSLTFITCNNPEETATNNLKSIGHLKAEDVNNTNDAYIHLKYIDTNKFIDSRKFLLQNQNGDFILLNEFPSKSFLKNHSHYINYNFIDIGNKDYPGVLGYIYTGGAHCCFIYTLYMPVGNNKFKPLFVYEGGDGAVSIDEKDGTLVVDFYEQLGYFYTCYACEVGLEDGEASEDGWGFPSHFKFRLKEDGTLKRAPKDIALNNEIFRLLNILKTKPIQNINTSDDSADMDDGIRKAYAKVIITYMFNNDASEEDLKELFYNYYNASDKAVIFHSIMESAESIKDFSLVNSLEKSNDNFKKAYKNFMDDVVNFED